MSPEELQSMRQLINKITKLEGEKLELERQLTVEKYYTEQYRNAWMKELCKNNPNL